MLNHPPCYSPPILPFSSLNSFIFPFALLTYINSLFKAQVLNNGGDSLNRHDHTGSGSQTASRPQTFLSQVTMVTLPPPLQLLHATVSQAAPPFSPKRRFTSPPPQGSSAASGRPPQQASEMQDKGTKRLFVPPMTPQPLCIQGAALNWHSHMDRRCAHMTLCDWCNKKHSHSLCIILQLMSMPMSSRGSSCHNVFGCDEVNWGELPPLTAPL